MSTIVSMIYAFVTMLSLYCHYVSGLDAFRVHEGFPDMITITSRASHLHGLATHYNELRVYPDMRFTCSGLITGFTAIGHRNTALNHSQGVGLKLQLWLPIYSNARAYSFPTSTSEVYVYPTPYPSAPPDTCKRYRPILGEMLAIQQLPLIRETSTEGMEMLDFSFPHGVLVVEGSVLAIQQLPQDDSYLTLFHQDGGGPQAYTSPLVDSPCLHPLNETGIYDYPLIAVNFTSLDGTGSCVNGFKTMADLTRITSSIYVNANIQPLLSRKQQRTLLFPTFTCGGYVTRWSIGVERGDRKEKELCPQLQIWKPDNFGQFELLTHNSLCLDNLNQTTYNNLYHVIPTDMMRFESNYYLGLNQLPIDTTPETKLYFVSYDLLNHDVLSDNSMVPVDDLVLQSPCERHFNPDSSCTSPVVSARVVCDSNCSDGCTKGFLNEKELIAISALVGNVTYATNNTYLFPNMRFTETRNIVAWEFAARSEPLTPRNAYLPHIEIWRSVMENREYYSIYDTTYNHSVTIEKTEQYNVYRYILDPPMEVVKDDIVAIKQPSQETSYVSVAFLQGTGHCYQILQPQSNSTLITKDDCDDEKLQPLIAPVIQPRVLSSLGPKTTPSNSTPSQENEEDEKIPLWVIVAVAIIGCLFAFIVTITLLLLCLWQSRKCSKRRNQKRESILNITIQEHTDNARRMPPCVTNEIHSTTIPTSSNAAYIYACSTTKNLAYGTITPCTATDNSSGSGYVVNQLVYEDVPQDMYDYIPTVM